MNDKPSDLTYEQLLETARKTIHPILDPGPEYGDDQRVFQGIPSIERAPGGRLWAVWYAGGQGEGPLNYIVLSTSGDDGQSWDTPVFAIDEPGHLRLADPCIWLDPDGRLWVFWTQVHTLHDGQWGVWAVTTDNPDDARPKWSEPRRLCDGVMLNKPTVLSDGDWLFPVSLLASKSLKNEYRMLPRFLRSEIVKLAGDEDKRRIDERHGAWVYASTDRGKTFTWRGRARAADDCSTHNEHMIVERSDGSLWMLLRTSYGLGQSTSNDRGATWTDVVEAGIPHTSSRFFLGKLASGRLLLLKHGPMDAPEDHKIKRSDLRAFISDDEGKTWSGGLVVEDRGCTYPDATQAPDGTIYAIYDHGRRHEKMILFAAFTEQDIDAGRFVSDKARPKMLINQATGTVPEQESWRRMKEQEEGGEELIYTGI